MSPCHAESRSRHVSAPMITIQFATNPATNTRTNASRSVPECMSPCHAESRSRHVSAPMITNQFATNPATNTRTNASRSVPECMSPSRVETCVHQESNDESEGHKLFPYTIALLFMKTLCVILYVFQLNCRSDLI